MNDGVIKSGFNFSYSLKWKTLITISIRFNRKYFIFLLSFKKDHYILLVNRLVGLTIQYVKNTDRVKNINKKVVNKELI